MKKVYTLLWCCAGLLSGLSAQPAFFATPSVQNIAITFKPDNWRYLLDSLRFNGEEFLAGDLRINGQALGQVGVRYRDGRSFTPGGRRNGLFIRLDAYQSGRQFEGHSVIDLSSALRDPSLVREVMAYEIARDYLPASYANYAQVTINGEPYGLMVNIEPVEGALLTRHFGGNQGNLYYANPDLENSPPAECHLVDYGSLRPMASENCYAHNFDQIIGNGWQPLVELTRQLAAPSANLENSLHIDRTLWMLAFNNLLLNLNSYTGQYAHNYYLYQDAEGRFSPLPGDLNLAFGSFKNTGIGESDLHTPELIQLDPMLHADSERRPLIRQLLANDYWRKRYLSHYRTILTEWFTNGRFDKRVLELRQQINPLALADPNQYYTADEYQRSLSEVVGARSRIPGLLDLMAKRTDWLKTQPVFTVIPPSVNEVTVDTRQRLSSQLLNEYRIHAKVGDFPKRVSLYYRLGTEGPFQMAAMYDDGQHFDQNAGDNIWGATVKPTQGEGVIQYYIEAENAAAIGYSPSRYMYELHQSSLEEINR